MKMRTYPGLFKPFRVADALFAAPEGLHDEPERFPYSAMAKRLGDKRDAFAAAALRCGPMYVTCKRHKAVRSLMAKAV